MGLSRRTGQRFQSSIWPGFVDAMTGLLLVLMFVLTIFMVIQFVLRETISGQETELNSLSIEIASLAEALGIERGRVASLETDLGALNANLTSAQSQLAQQTALIAALTQERNAQAADLAERNAQITAFEAQVAGLLATQNRNEQTISELNAQKDALISDKDTLALALATARDEIDVATQEARRKAAEREALQALIVQLERDAAAAQDTIASQAQQIDTLDTRISEAEAAQLVSAAAAQELRNRLQNADAELTAMTLALEQQRKKAEDTLILLAAADQAKAGLEKRLQDTLFQLEATKLSGQQEIDRLNAENAANLAAAREIDIALAASLARQQNLEQQIQDLRDRMDVAAQREQNQKTTLTNIEAELAQALLTLKQEREQMQSEQAGLEKQLADLTAELERTDDQKLRNRTLERDLAQALADQMAAQSVVTDTRAQLEAALAAKLAAEELANDRLSAVQEREALLSQARAELLKLGDLTDQKAKELLDAQKRTTVLNEQVAALRQDLARLQNLLDESEAKDQEANVQIQNLGNRLNNALARVAAEEKKNRKLEEAERKRLEQERNSLATQAEELARYKSEFFGKMRDILDGQDGVQIVGDRFVFSSEVLFDPGQAELQEAGKNEIDNVVDILKSVMNDIPEGLDWVLRVDGHTDNIPLSGLGEFKDNWELSQARALSVVRYMAQEMGMPADRLAANGFGEFQPVSTANTEEARRRNRRIEIKLTEK